MESLEKSKNNKYESPIIWVEDLNKIFSLLEKHGEITIESGKIKYDSIEEFFTHNKHSTLSNIKISIFNPTYIKLEINRITAQLYISSLNAESAGIFYSIDSILKECERKPKFLHQYRWFFLLIILFYIFPYLSFYESYKHIHAIFSLPIGLWALYLSYTKLFGSKIHVLSKKDKPNFFTKNRDAILLNIFFVLLGALATYGIPKLFDKVQSENNNKELQEYKPPSENIYMPDTNQ